MLRPVSFNQVANALLDAGYLIDKKDNDLQTLKTEAKQFPKYWDAKYVINIRVKDSVAYITGRIHAATIFTDDPSYYQTNNKGALFEKGLFGYPFSLMIDFAKSLGGTIEYKKDQL